MSPAAAAVGRPPLAAAGRFDAESGLRLLVGGARRRQLRWSPDPSSPDARPLRAGELRLAIRWLELTAQDLPPAGTRGPSAGSGAADWQPVAAIGAAEVVESRLAAATPGQWLIGPLHIGTHQVLRVVSTGEAGCIAAACGQPAPPDLHYAWIPPAPRPVSVAGPDAVEQAVAALRERALRADAAGHGVRLSLSTTGG